LIDYLPILKCGELTRSWTARVRFLASWADADSTKTITSVSSQVAATIYSTKTIDLTDRECIPYKNYVQYKNTNYKAYKAD